MKNKELQKELLEKVKPGTKPSDLRSKPLAFNKDNDIKKRGQKQAKRLVSPSPISISDDEGYISEEEEEKNIVPTVPTSQQIKDLQTEINTLKKQLQTYKDFKEADLKIKESLKETSQKQKKEIEYWKKTVEKSNTLIADKEESIKELQEKVDRLYGGTDKKLQAKVKPELFTCYHCHKSQSIPLLVLELPEGKLCQPCWTILRKKTKENLQNPVLNQTFICIACDQEKQETPIYKKVEISYKTRYELIKDKERSILPFVKGRAYPVCSSCSIHVKEYNEHEDQEFSPGEN